jgi:hypothetical protein
MEVMRRLTGPSIVTLGAIGAVIAVVVWALDPSLLLSNSTITGGDTGAHFGTAAFLKSSLLPHGHLTGWFPGAYDGLPLYTFYFPLPDALAAAAGYVIPFNVAFKLMTILGSVTLPVAAWVFGRLAGMEHPRPAVLALATLPFLFDQSYTIYGGNLFSTLAGEYAFSLGLSLALVFLGAAIRGMRTGQMRLTAILLLATCVLCHVIAAMFAVAGALVIFVVFGPSWRRLRWMATVLGTGFLLVAWWAVPFIVQQGYSTTMGWQNVTTYAMYLAPGGNRWALVLAAVGVLVACIRVERTVFVFTVLGVGAALLFWRIPQGALYNTRLIPMWWLCVYLVAGYAVAEIGVMTARQWRRLREALRWEAAAVPSASSAGVPTPAFAAGVGAGVSAGAGAVVAGRQAMGGDPRAAGGSGLWRFGNAATAVTERAPGSTWAPTPSVGAHGVGERAAPPAWRRRPWLERWAPGAITVPLAALIGAGMVVLPDLVVAPTTHWHAAGLVTVQRSGVPAWAQWNYSGYEAKASWPEFHAVMTTMDRVGRQDGCGRAMWEYNANLNRFGTPMAPMLLPYYTDGCIDSMEGLLFESASSTPWHFINQAELSAGPSEAMVSQTTHIRYGPLDVALGVQHLQLMGVRYFMATSPQVQAQADLDPDLTLVATSGPWQAFYQGEGISTTWKIYEVKQSSLVVPLTEQPAVLAGVHANQSSWLPVAQQWYADPARWSQELVAGGLPSWPSAPNGTVLTRAKALPTVHVSNVRVTEDHVTFHVDRTGEPVLVKVSYFPDWHAQGALGPWRAEPNLMVVVPTGHDVTLSYGSSHAGTLGLLLTFAGVVVVVVLLRRRFIES